MKKKTRKEKSPRKRLDEIFSRFIRWRDKGQCYTCAHKDDPKRMQCGHFVPRQYISVRYDERNCHCQCYACNMLFNGQPGRFALNLVRDYGEGIVEELEAHKSKVERYFPYEEKIAQYAQLVEEFSRTSFPKRSK